jgi:hypothetical protein
MTARRMHAKPLSYEQGGNPPCSSPNEQEAYPL